MTTVQTRTPTDVSRTWIRISGFAGITLVVLFIGLGASIAAGAPAFTAGADELRTWFADNQGPIALFTWISPLAGGVLQLLFAAGLLHRLTARDTSGGILPRVAFGGAIAGFAATVGGLALWGVMTLDPVLEGASDGLLVTLAALDSVVFFVLIPWTIAVFVLAASVMMLQTRAMPAWLGGLGCLSAIASVIGGTWLFSGDPDSALADVSFLGTLVFLLWVLITSVLLIRRTSG